MGLTRENYRDRLIREERITGIGLTREDYRDRVNQGG